MRADALPSAVAVWSFSNVTVNDYHYPTCFHGPMVQGSVSPSSVVRVDSGEKLLAALNNATAR
jgi:hypothetical protein